MLMQDELGIIARDLLADLERAREGFPQDRDGFTRAARERMRLRLSDLRAQYHSLGADGDFDRVQRELEDVMLGRYVQFAFLQSDRDRHGGGGWRGGDVVSRLALGFGGLAIGGFMVWAPFIPIWEKWFPFALMFVAPFLPDVQAMWQTRKHRRELLRLERDLTAAGNALSESRPLTGLEAPAESESRPQPQALKNKN